MNKTFCPLCGEEQSVGTEEGLCGPCAKVVLFRPYATDSDFCEHTGAVELREEGRRMGLVCLSCGKELRSFKVGTA